jgi:hypothetical protein
MYGHVFIICIPRQELWTRKLIIRQQDVIDNEKRNVKYTILLTESCYLNTSMYDDSVYFHNATDIIQKPMPLVRWEKIWVELDRLQIYQNQKSKRIHYMDI